MSSLKPCPDHYGKYEDNWQLAAQSKTELVAFFPGKKPDLCCSWQRPKGEERHSTGWWEAGRSPKRESDLALGFPAALGVQS